MSSVHIRPTLYVAATFVLLVLLCLFNSWWFTSILQLNYLVWYSHAGPVIALGTVLIGVAWGDLDKHTDLISAHPLYYIAACLQVASLPLIAAGAHLKAEHRLVPLGWNMIPLLLLTPLLVAAMFGWLLLVVPVQYFVFLLTGAFSRAALTSSAQLVARVDDGKVAVIESTPGKPITPAVGQWDASMRDKPLTLTNAFSAALLFVLAYLFGS